jgi:hypothetical protein
VGVVDGIVVEVADGVWVRDGAWVSVYVGTAVVDGMGVCDADGGDGITGRLVAVEVGSDKPHESEINARMLKRNSKLDRAGFFTGFLYFLCTRSTAILVAWLKGAGSTGNARIWVSG